MSPQQHSQHLLEEAQSLERELEQRRKNDRNLPQSVMLAYQRTIAARYETLRTLSED